MKKTGFLAMLALLLCFSLPMPVSAAREGYWERTYTLEYLASQQEIDDTFYGSAVRISGGEGQFGFSQTLTEDATCNNDHYHDWDHEHTNETFSGTFSFSQPVAVCDSGEYLSFDLCASADGSSTFCEATFFSLSVQVMPVAAEERMQYGTGDAAINSIYVEYLSRSYHLKSADNTYSAEAYMSGNYCEKQTAKTVDAVLTHEMPAANPGDTLYYLVLFESGNFPLGYIVYEYTYRSGEAVPSVVSREGEEPFEPGDRYADTNADKISGEMLIAISATIGAVLVGGGLIALKNGKKKKTQKNAQPKEELSEEKKEEQNEEKRYEMRVYKDFGDTIYVGRSVTVGARIVELTAQGAELPCPTLTEQIHIFSSDYLEVADGALSGQYKNARVTAPDSGAATPQTAVISFRLANTAGGSFTGRVRFQIKKFLPRVVFPDMPSYSSQPILNLIAGDNGTYRIRFFFADVGEEPKIIQFGSYGNYEITAEPADTEYTYFAVVKNRTAPMDNKVIYERYPFEFVGFTAIFADGTEVKESFMICRYPEGLSVIAKQQGGMIPVQAYEKEYRGDLDPAFQAAELHFTYAQRNSDGAQIIEPKEGDISLNNLRGEGAVEKIASSYSYTVSTVNGSCYLEPHDMIYETVGGEQFPMVIDAVFQNNPDSKLTLPLNFIPKKLTPMSDWEVEYDKLANRLERFALPENKAKYVEMLNKLDKDNISVYELRLMSKDLVRAYMRYWSAEGKKQMTWENTLGWLEFGAGFIDFIGDCAFSYLITVYGGGPYVEAVLSPAKDLLAEFLGRVGGNILFFGDGVSWDGFLKMTDDAVKSAFDSILYEMIPGKEEVFKAPSIKKVGSLLAGYFMFNFALNFIKNLADRCDPEEMKKYERLSVEKMEERFSYTHNLYEALIGTFQDMSKRIVGEMLGKLFKNYLDNPEIQAKIEKLMRDFAHWQMVTRIKAEFRKYVKSDSRELFGSVARYDQYKDFYQEAGEKMIPQANMILEEYVKKLIEKGYGYSFEVVRAGVGIAHKAFGNDDINIDHSVEFHTDPDGSRIMTTAITDLSSGDIYKINSNLDKTFDENLDNPLFRDMSDHILGNISSFPSPISMPKEPPLPQGR